MTENMVKAFNQQINNEMYSEYYYIAMSAYCESIDLPGFAAWMMAQADEERVHALRFYRFLLDRDAMPVFDKIDAPKSEFKSILDMFEHVLEHEQFVTSKINELYALALKEGDFASQIELQWFITEQVEEEKTAKEIIQQIKWIGNAQSALYMLDQKMGERQQSGGAAE